MKKIALLMFMLLGSMAFAKAPLIPMPQEVKWDQGTMNLSSARISAPSSLSNEAKFLHRYLAGEKIRATLVNSPSKANIILSLGKVESPNNIKGAYTLKVTSNQVKIVANEAAGVFWAIQTLRQMISNKRIPTATIKDFPVHEVRGFMHDVGRNFISVGALKDHLDLMSLYKFNIFHFHVTENQGWRLESKIYPQLTNPEFFTRKVDKFYSQQDFKDLVEFCRQRHITIIPEFDIPGHSLAFRKAFNIKSMREERARTILVELVNELCSLVPAEIMPYIHVGSDEVRHAEEKVDAKEFFTPICAAIRKNKRQVLGWVAGMLIEGDKNIIQQVWAPFRPHGGIPWIDSRTNYINHLDHFMAATRMVFQKPGWGVNNDKLLGGIICSWPDSPVEDDRGVYAQNPIFICTVGYGETLWRGRENNEPTGWANIPEKGPLYDEFKNFEDRMLVHRDRYFRDKEFNYVRQSNIPWKIINFPSDNNDKAFPVESAIKPEYEVDGKKITWLDNTYYGATITLTHFWGHRTAPAVFASKSGTAYALNYIYSPKEQNVGFWISFQDFSRSDWRGAPLAKAGQWLKTNPKIWVNNQEVEPPVLKNAGKNFSSDREQPFTDENYVMRPPTQVKLKKGWNKFLLKIPSKDTWKWMFTCVPVEVKGRNVREVQGLKYSTKPE